MFVWRPLNSPSPAKPAVDDRDLRLAEVVLRPASARDAGWSLVDWSRKPDDAVDAVRLDLAGHDRRADERDADAAQHADVHGLEPGDDEHRDRAHDDHERRAEVVLQEHERHHEARRARPRPRAGQASRSPRC